MDSDRLVRYVAGEADDAERAAIERWASAAPENQRELAGLRAAWELGAQGEPLPDVDVGAAWSRVSERMDRTGGGTVIPIGRSAGWTRWLAVAAVVAGVVFATRLFFAPEMQEVVASNERVSAVLPDSSRVVVSPNSALKARMDDQRRVDLHGQAYFEVKRDETKPFVVRTGDVEVMVLGTAFEVTAYDTADAVLVRVRHGRVRVAAGAGTLELTAGQHARYDRSTGSLQRPDVPPVEIWAGRVIQFDHATLAQVAAELEHIFAVRIELAHAGLERCELTATFDDEPIDAVLRVISDTFGLRIEERGPRQYVLDGDGC